MCRASLLSIHAAGLALPSSALIRIKVQGSKASEHLARTAFLHVPARKASKGKVYIRAVATHCQSELVAVGLASTADEDGQAWVYGD